MSPPQTHPVGVIAKGTAAQTIAANLVHTGAAGIWAREEGAQGNPLDAERVHVFAEMYAEDGPGALPPIVVVGDGAGGYLLADGHHRYHAQTDEKTLGDMHLSAIVVAAPAGTTPDQYAYLVSLTAIAGGTLSLTPKQRRANAERLILEADRSDREIARLVGVSHASVGTWRKQLENATERPSTEASSGDLAQRCAKRLIGAFVEIAPHCDRDPEEVGRMLAREILRVYPHRDNADAVSGAFVEAAETAALEIQSTPDEPELVDESDDADEAESMTLEVSA